MTRGVAPSRRAELYYLAEMRGVVREIEAAARSHLWPVMDAAAKEARARDEEMMTSDAPAASALLQTPAQRAEAEAKRKQEEARRRAEAAKVAISTVALAAALDKMTEVLAGIAARGEKIATEAAKRALADTDKALAINIKRQTGSDVAALLRIYGAPKITTEARIAAGVELIASIPAKAIERLRSALSVPFRAAADMYAAARAALAITSRRARNIARDQTAHMHGEMNRARQVRMGIDRYVWRTALDERVRPKHREKEGKIFDWANPPEDTGHPGYDYNCRCVAVPYFESIPAALQIPAQEEERKAA